jgi:ribosome biogenesis GTPase
MQALVYKSTGSWYQVRNEKGEAYRARIRGKLKIDGITSTNPVAVGDYVKLEAEPDDENMIITEILPRRNYINRVSPHNRNQHHIIASNLDQSLLFATLKDPKTSLGFIDRFLVISEAYHVPVFIVFNKVDIYRKKEMDVLEEIRAMYGKIGYLVFDISMQTGHGLDNLMQMLHGKTTLLSGHSGVGKSSFINHIFPDMELKTGEVSNWSGKGMHTTTFAEMFDLPHGGRIIDTPGIREMGLVDIEKEELAHYFPEMREVMSQCKFHNCIHVEEPGCAVKAALETGEISIERYASYRNILDTIVARSY